MPESPVRPALPRDLLVQPSPAMPLAGLTLLAVEDSRHACDALRLMAQRSGARLRRAATVAEGRRHLCVYRPDLVIVDPGLPDGSGLGLVADIAAGPAAPPVIVWTGSEGMEDDARRAGAARCLSKPFAELAAFQRAVCACLPDRAWLAPPGVAAGGDRLPPADPLALRDDLSAAARRLALGPDEGEARYLAGFVAGIARSAGDAGLALAAGRAARSGPQGAGDLARAVADCLRRSAGPLALS